jgi:hypothetical protein
LLFGLIFPGLVVEFGYLILACLAVSFCYFRLIFPGLVVGFVIFA